MTMTMWMIFSSILLVVGVFFIILGKWIDRVDSPVEKRINVGGKSKSEEMEIAVNTTTYGTMKEFNPMPPLPKVFVQELQKAQERQSWLEKEGDERRNRERMIREQREQRERRQRQTSDSVAIDNSAMHIASSPSYSPSYSPSCDSSSSSSSSSSSDSGSYSGGCD